MTKIYNLFQNSKIYLENIIQFSLKIFVDFFFNMLYIFSVLQVQVRPVRAAHPGLKANLQDVKLVRPGTSSLATNKEKIIKVRLINILFKNGGNKSYSFIYLYIRVLQNATKVENDKRPYTTVLDIVHKCPKNLGIKPDYFFVNIFFLNIETCSDASYLLSATFGFLISDFYK